MRFVLSVYTGIAGFLGLGLVSATQALANDCPSGTALIGATVIDGAGGSSIPDAAVVICGDEIFAVGSSGDIEVPNGVETVDVTGKWLMPGLIDAHVHFFQSGSLYTRPDIYDLRSIRSYEEELEAIKAGLADTFARYLASGVTAAVDVGGPLWNFDVRRRAAESVRAPRVAVAGPLIATEPTPRQKRLDLGDPPIISATTPAHARKLARSQLSYKPDMIKVWGIPGDEQGIGRVREITAAVVEVAKPAGVRVAVHAQTFEAARAAAEGGADILVHSVEDRVVDSAFVDLLKDRDILYVTTAMVDEGYRDAAAGNVDLSVVERRLGAQDAIVSLYEMPAAIKSETRLRAADRYLANVQENARLLLRAGVRVAAGSDAGNIGTLPGPAIHRELTLLAAAGLTPAEVITTVTYNAAHVYDPEPEIGLIKPGFGADLLLLNADPLEDVRNISDIATVWVRGVSYTPDELIEPSPEAVVQLQVDRYNARELDGFTATYAPNVEIYDLPDGATPELVGRDALKARYGRFFEEHPDGFCHIVQRIALGDYVIDREYCRFDPDGEPHRTSAIYQVAGGLIQRVWFADE